MRARDEILGAVKKNKPLAVSLPVVNMDDVIGYPDVVLQFKEIMKSIGAEVIEVSDEPTIDRLLNAQRSNGKNVVNVLDKTAACLKKADARQLALIDLVVMRGMVAVAENGAVWVDEKQMGNRLLPFICQHLILVLYKKDIVATMHHAYKLIGINKEGFGAFIAGPSKTADIEQSLVIGAHGPVSMNVYLLENSCMNE